VSVGLLARSESGRVYDRLRNRVVFPIRDVRGRVLGFGGRALGEDRAKYLNSPDSEVYDKSQVLYGLYEARLAIGRENLAIVCEGYFDVLALAQAGIGNAVATCGTALTQDQVRMLRRYTTDVALLFDTDAAGRAASLRAMGPLFEADIWPRRVVLDGAKDPDEFLRKFGAEALRKAVDEAPPLLDVVIDETVQEFAGDPRAPDRVLERLAPSLVHLSPPMLRKYMQTASKALLLPQQDLEAGWRRLAAERRPVPGPRAPQPGPVAEPAESIPVVEGELLRLLHERPAEVVEDVLNRGVLDLLSHPAVSAYLARAIHLWQEAGELPGPEALLLESNNEALERLIAGHVIEGGRDPQDQHFRNALAECLIRIEIAALERRDQNRKRAILEARSQGNVDDHVRELLRSHARDSRRLADLQMLLRNQGRLEQARQEQAAPGR
jgi:DNA primase